MMPMSFNMTLMNQAALHSVIVSTLVDFSIEASEDIGDEETRNEMI